MERSIAYELQRIVDVISVRMVTGLQKYNPDIKKISFSFGHLGEINNTLISMSEDPVQRREKFPRVMLLTPYSEFTAKGGGDYPTVKMTLFIAAQSDSRLDRNERQVKTFDPILHPIKAALIREISHSQCFVVYDPKRDMVHTITEHDYWGKAGANGNQKNTLAEYVDVITIKDLELKRNIF